MLTAITVCSIYVLALLVLTKKFGVKYTEITKSTDNIKHGIVYPVGIGAVLLTIYAVIAAWIPDVFSIERPAQSALLWVIPIVTIIAIVARLAYAKIHEFDIKGRLYLLFGTFAVGYSEELLVRGIAVHALLDQGYSIVMTGIISSVLFGLLHFMNYFNGQDLKKTSIQVAGTIVMGLNFYLTLVISGTLWLPIIIHFLYDLSILLLGPDPKIPDSTRGRVIGVATLFVFVLPVLGLVFLV